MSAHLLNTQTQAPAHASSSRADEVQARKLIQANFPRLSMTAWQVLLAAAPYLPPHAVDGSSQNKSDSVDPATLLELARDFDDDDLLDDDVSDEILAMSAEEIAALRLVSVRYDRHWMQEFPTDLSLAALLAAISGRKEAEVFQ